MKNSSNSNRSAPPIVQIAAGADRDGEQHPLGISVIHFKVIRADNPDIFVIENTFHARGGPARHLHYQQDEYFYALEGTFLIEVGEQRFTLNPGDSLLAARMIPHCWAFIGQAPGRILITFTPAGKMEEFFREVSRTNAMPIQDPALWKAHGMELLGPPLSIEKGDGSNPNTVS